MRAIGFDLGSVYTKAVLLDNEGKVELSRYATKGVDDAKAVGEVAHLSTAAARDATTAGRVYFGDVCERYTSGDAAADDVNVHLGPRRNIQSEVERVVVAFPVADLFAPLESLLGAAQVGSDSLAEPLVTRPGSTAT